MYQRWRVYSLVVGNKDRAVEFNNALNISFRCVKSSNNKDRKNEASIEIYNLAPETQKLLEEPYVQVELKVGYVDDDSLVPLFRGQVKNVSSSSIPITLTNRKGATLVTKLDLEELFEPMNNTAISRTIPSGKTVKDAILEIARGVPEISRHEIRGTRVDTTLLDGAVLAGTPRYLLDKISREYLIEYTIDQGVLYVSDLGGTYTEDKTKVPLIGQMSGLIERPEFVNEEARRFQRAARAAEDGTAPAKEKNPKSNSLRLKVLLNPRLKAGGLFKLDFERLSGYYKIDSIEHVGEWRGQDWYSTITCTQKLE